jgi:hypothetical protein
MLSRGELRPLKVLEKWILISWGFDLLFTEAAFVGACWKKVKKVKKIEWDCGEGTEASRQAVIKLNAILANLEPQYGQQERCSWIPSKISRLLGQAARINANHREDPKNPRRLPYCWRPFDTRSIVSSA